MKWAMSQIQSPWLLIAIPLISYPGKESYFGIFVVRVSLN